MCENGDEVSSRKREKTRDAHFVWVWEAHDTQVVQLAQELSVGLEGEITDEDWIG